jgi:hypothetical protein
MCPLGPPLLTLLTKAPQGYIFVRRIGGYDGWPLEEDTSLYDTRADAMAFLDQCVNFVVDTYFRQGLECQIVDNDPSDIAVLLTDNPILENATG